MSPQTAVALPQKLLEHLLHHKQTKFTAPFNWPLATPTPTKSLPRLATPLKATKTLRRLPTKRARVCLFTLCILLSVSGLITNTQQTHNKHTTNARPHKRNLFIQPDTNRSAGAPTHPRTGALGSPFCYLCFLTRSQSICVMKSHARWRVR